MIQRASNNKFGFMRSTVMTYNPWYCATYETILGMAAWSNLSEDIEKKIVCIFSWMPQTIMAVRHPDKRFKFELYSVKILRDALAPLQERFNGIREQRLMEFDIGSNTEILEALCAALFPALGSVGGSKFLHFSAPILLPMWDRQIRLAGKHGDTGAGYVEFMAAFQEALTVDENRDEALRRYPSNIVRGWDIVCMERRRTPTKVPSARGTTVIKETKRVGRRIKARPNGVIQVSGE